MPPQAQKLRSVPPSSLHTRVPDSFSGALEETNLRRQAHGRRFNMDLNGWKDSTNKAKKRIINYLATMIQTQDEAGRPRVRATE
jgi:hypothetical protein